MLDKKLTIYKSLDLHKPEIPPRSYFYSLEPIGVGTPYCESFTSFLMRLAREHCVSMDKLLAIEIIQQLEEEGYLPPYSRGIESETFKLLYRFKALNGIGVRAAKLVQILEVLTSRSGLSSLTMLSWSQVIPLTRLFRFHQTWCPPCYEEWQMTGQVVYDPLLWCLKPVKLCPNHYRPLVQQCPHCQQQLTLSTTSAWRARPGYCSKCGGWLGNSLSTKVEHEPIASEDELKWQKYVTKSLGELIAATPDLSSPPTKDRIAEVTNACLNYVFKDNVTAFAQFLGVKPNYLYLYLQKKHIPTIDNLLQLTYGLNISPLEFLTGNVETILGYLDVRQQPSSPPKQSNNRTGKRLDRKKIHQVMEEAFQEEPPPTIRAVAKRLECHSHSLRYHFPDLYNKLKNRRADFFKVKALHHEKKRLLKAALTEEPPPSLQEIVRRVGYKSSRTLYQLFPQLCKQVSKRYTEYRQTRGVENRKQICSEIRQVAFKMHHEGKEPKQTNIRHVLTKPRYMRHRFAKNALAAVRRELGYED